MSSHYPVTPRRCVAYLTDLRDGAALRGRHPRHLRWPSLCERRAAPWRRRRESSGHRRLGTPRRAVTGPRRVAATYYALTLAKRLKTMGSPKYQDDGNPRTGGPGLALMLHADQLEIPYRWRRRRDRVGAKSALGCDTRDVVSAGTESSCSCRRGWLPFCASPQSLRWLGAGPGSGRGLALVTNCSACESGRVGRGPPRATASERGHSRGPA